MIVTRQTVDLVLERLRPVATISVDTETTSLRPYHEAKMFSLILGAETASGKVEGYYLNFWPDYPDLAPDFALDRTDLAKLKPLFEDPKKTWFIHKSNFDLHFLGQEGIEIAGEVFCTLVQGRVEYNEHQRYGLGESLARIGEAKDDKVEKWISDHKAYETVLPPGKTVKKKNKFFYKVPWDIIVPYGIDDAVGCYKLGQHLKKSIKSQSEEYPKGAHTLEYASAIETRLAKTVYRMEKVGVKIDRPYIKRALHYESDRSQKAVQSFRRNTGRDYQASPKLFAELFASEKDKWAYTDKGNPSFESDALGSFENPAARDILTIRDAKSKLDFYHGFLYHADADDVVHPQFNAGGTRTLRFSSSEPNFQNMTSEEATFCRACKKWFEELTHECPDCDSTDIEHPEFMVRRSIIPRPGFVFFLPDYDQMELKMLLDYAKDMMMNHLRERGQTWHEDYFLVANQVRDGLDVHKATASLTGLPRWAAKAINFGLLYGEGNELLSKNLNVSLSEAMALKAQYFRGMPYVQHMILEIMKVIRTRGWIRNWAGQKYNFPDRGKAYTGPNRLIQGGCAHVTKKAMNEIDELLLPRKSRLVMSVHDELPSEIHESEVGTAPQLIVQAMESVYPYKHIPLTVGAEWSPKSLADKMKGYPC